MLKGKPRGLIMNRNRLRILKIRFLLRGQQFSSNKTKIKTKNRISQKLTHLVHHPQVKSKTNSSKDSITYKQILKAQLMNLKYNPTSKTLQIRASNNKRILIMLTGTTTKWIMLAKT